MQEQPPSLLVCALKSVEWLCSALLLPSLAERVAPPDREESLRSTLQRMRHSATVSVGRTCPERGSAHNTAAAVPEGTISRGRQQSAQFSLTPSLSHPWPDWLETALR